MNYTELRERVIVILKISTIILSYSSIDSRHRLSIETNLNYEIFGKQTNCIINIFKTYSHRTNLSQQISLTLHILTIAFNENIIDKAIII